ncbi:hypothetical protein [endosymbiont GvMRE of Glomus versiforme]|uniref:hypothetical protein n=1 Tax=endosymbiont GvMRE of Glomus versiforme TaxID=2039283 RepID=UPI0011C4A864|nr:hypothetical protein [endosymbiont GvMRE of Glomus versiforme]
MAWNEVNTGLTHDRSGLALKLFNVAEQLVWNVFFTSPNGNNADALDDANDAPPRPIRSGWKDSGLSPVRPGVHDSEADQAWANGWRDLRNNNGDVGNAGQQGGRITGLRPADKDFTYTSYGQTTNNVKPHERRKDDLDQAHRARATYVPPQQTELDYNGIIQRIRDEMQKSPPVSDSGLNAELGQSNWESWLRDAQDKNELDSRESQAISAVKEARRKEENPSPLDLNKVINEAIQAVKDHWKEKAGSETGKINGQDQKQVLGSWEEEIRKKDSETAINAERDRLKELINTEKAKEGSAPPGPGLPGGPYPDNGDPDSGEGDDSGKTPPGGKEDGKKPIGPEEKTPGGKEDVPTDSSGEEIKEEEWKNVSPSTVDKIVKENEATNIQSGKDKDANLEKIKEILKKVNQAKGKEKYNEPAKTLQEELNQIQSSSLVTQLESLKKEVNEAIQHLEKLEKESSQTQDQAPKSWWQKQPTWAKVAIIFGILTAIILIGIIISQLTKKKQVSEEEE